MARIYWTAEAEAELRRLWAEGHSSAEIGRRMGGLSKNAVVGRRHRLKLPPRPSPIPAATPGGGAGHAPVRRGTSAPRSEAAPPSPPVPDARPGTVRAVTATPLPGRVPAVASPAPLPIRAPRAAGRGCLWPMWKHHERPGPAPRFCDAPRDEDPACRMPYCRAHRLKARAVVQKVQAPQVFVQSGWGAAP